MTPIRPNVLPLQPAPQPAGDTSRAAAQKAFFAMAMGQATAPAAAPAARAQMVTAPPPLQRTPSPTAEAPTRILRPGSLLDIRV